MSKNRRGKAKAMAKITTTSRERSGTQNPARHRRYLRRVAKREAERPDSPENRALAEGFMRMLSRPSSLERSVEAGVVQIVPQEISLHFDHPEITRIGDIVITTDKIISPKDPCEES